MPTRQELLNIFFDEARKNGCSSLANDLINLGANFHRREEKATVALMVAAKTGDLMQVIELSKDDPNLVDNNNRTALTYACEGGHLPIVKHLLSQNADPLIRDNSYYREHALVLAAKNGHSKVVDVLLPKICDLYPGVMWPLNEALKESFTLEDTTISEKITKKISSVPIYILETAVKSNNIAMMKKLIPKLTCSIDEGLGQFEHYTLLGTAASAGLLEMAKLLLENGADPNVVFGFGASALYLAAKYGHLEMTRMLLEEYDADPNKPNNAHSYFYIYSPLMIAARNNHSEIIRLLVQHGARINTIRTYVLGDVNCETALDLAKNNKAIEAVEVLRELGAKEAVEVLREIGPKEKLYKGVF